MQDPLFSDNFLSHYLSDFKLSNVPNLRLARNTIESLIEELNSGKLESLKEEEFKSRFLNEFFGDVLGFNYGNSNFWTLREEVKTQVDGTKPDGALGFFSKNKIDNDVRAIIEIKDALTDLDTIQKRKNPKSPVDQAFEYASKMGENCKWVIVSNFKEIRFYKSNFRGKYQVYYLDQLTDENRLKEVLYLFHKDRLINRHNSFSSTEQLYKKSSLKLKENEKPKHIVDEIYSSLIRFQGLQYVDPNYLASIKPFNILDDHVWHFEEGDLRTINPRIFVLFNELEFQDGSIILSDQLRKDLEDINVIEYEDKIEWFIKFLNHSQIKEISCVKDYKSLVIRKSRVIGFSHKHHFSISKKDGYTKNIDILKYKSCDCLTCNYTSYNFERLINKLKTAQFKDEFLTLEYAFGNYLVSANNYKNAYNIYKKFSENVKGKEGLEVQYFIAKLNMKYLHNLVMEDETLKDSIEIKQEIRNIDLNKILYEEIEYNISDDVRNYLVKIKEEKLLIQVKAKVNELVEKIISLKKFLETENAKRIGSNHIQELADNYYQLQLHLNRNRIIYSVFYEYKLLVAKVFEGFIESYLTKDDGLNFFNSYYLIEFVTNIGSTEFTKLISKVDLIELEEGNDSKVVENISNLLRSFLKDGIFPTPYENIILKEYLLDYHFRDNYSTLITNSFSLLSKIQINDSLYPSLIKLIIDFLNIEDVLAWHGLKELGRFLYNKGANFSSENLINILSIAIERDKPNNNKYEELIRVSSITLNKFYPEVKINNKQLIKKAIGNISGIPKWNSISLLLKVTDENCSEILNNEIEDFLNENWSFNFYDHLIRKKLYDHKKKRYFIKYVQEISKSNEKGFVNKFENDKPIFEGYRFYNFVILMNILKIDLQEIKPNDFVNISNYEKWILKPKQFDYSDFDVKWILATQNNYILDSLKGIKELISAVENELKQKFDPILAKTYYNNLL